jgi:thymidine phosphorylase
MDRVLGRTAGNALEVRESIDHLTGAAKDPRLLEVTLELCRELLKLGRIDADPEQALGSGAAAERFGAMVAGLGGPAELLEQPGEHLPAAPVVVPVRPERPGRVTGVNCRAVGLVVTALGGNRAREDDTIDHAVGLSQVAGVGAEVGPDRPLAMIHARGDAQAEAAAAALRSAYQVGEEAPDPRPVVLGRIE